MLIERVLPGLFATREAAILDPEALPGSPWIRGCSPKAGCPQLTGGLGGLVDHGDMIFHLGVRFLTDLSSGRGE